VGIERIDSGDARNAKTRKQFGCARHISGVPLPHGDMVIALEASISLNSTET